MGPFRFFSKIGGDIRSLRCTTGVIDIGGKFAAGVVDTGCKVSTGINDTSGIGGKFATGVVDTCGAP